jgi:hypothetical protein
MQDNRSQQHKDSASGKTYRELKQGADRLEEAVRRDRRALRDLERLMRPPAEGSKIPDARRPRDT